MEVDVTIKGLHTLGRASDEHASSVEMHIIQVARGKGTTRQGDWDEVIRLLDEYGIHPNAIVCPRRGFSLLSFAATEPAPDACKRLMAMGADPRHGGKWSRTPLIHAIHARDGRWGSRNRQVVDLLASTIDEQDSDGRTALMFASVGAGLFSSKRGNLDIIRQLVAHGADLSIRNRWGRTALMDAIQANDASRSDANADVVDLLKSYTIEQEARRLFEENYRATFSDTGELTLRPTSALPASSAMPEAPSAPKSWTRTRAVRVDATVQAISRKVEKFFGLPQDSVALVDKKRKPLPSSHTIGALWQKHSK